MTVRTPRLVGLVATSALVAAAAIIPQAATASASPHDPVFYAVSAPSVAVARHSGVGSVNPGAAKSAAADTASRKADLAKSLQVLQVISGIQAAGSDGLSVAAGPKHVIELGAQTARAFAKNTTRQVATTTTNKFFGISGAVLLTQPTIAYDPMGKRFVAVAVIDDAGDLGLTMRISKSSAAVPFSKKNWLKPIALGNADAFDEAQPRVGISANKIAITATTSTPATPNRIFFLPKAQYYKGQTPGAWAADVDSTYDGQAPAVNQTKAKNLFIAIPATSDVTLTTYKGGANGNPPAFSTSVVYPATSLTAPPTVIPSAGDALDLGGLSFDALAWRDNKLWAASTGNCTGFACVRVIGLKTKAGVSIASDETLKATGHDFFSPALAVDGGDNLHVTLTSVGGKEIGPSQATFVRKGPNKWTKIRYIRKGTSGVDGPGGTVDWWRSNSAASDPTSVYDIWIAGASGDAMVPGNHLTTLLARVSLARNVATLKVKYPKPAKHGSAHRGSKGKSTTFTVKLSRPGGGAIKGQPVSLQRKPLNGGHWKTVSSGKTSASGEATWLRRIKKTTLYRTVGEAVTQKGHKTVVYDQVFSHHVKVKVK